MPDLDPQPAIVPATSSEPEVAPRRTSALLSEFAQHFPRDRVRLCDLGEMLGARSFGFLLLLFALPNALPVTFPGFSTITGIPLALVAMQMMLGRERPYLPSWLGNRSIAASDFRRLVEKAVPWLRRLESLMRPRWVALTSPRGERLLGGVSFVLALILCLPIPLGNLLPAIAIVLVALGVIERDGMSISAGLVAGLAGAALASGVVWGMAEAGLYVLQQALT